MSYERELAMLAERTHDVNKKTRQANLQRRHTVTEIYGQEYSSQGDANTPATVYLPVSKDLVYHEVMEIQIRISDFSIPFSNESSAGLMTDEVSLTYDEQTKQISPNPHKHTISGGIGSFPTSSNKFRIEIQGIDITGAIKEKYNGNWIDGNGIFPKSDDGLAHYNLLEILPYLHSWQQNVLLSSGLKEIKIYGNGLFRATVVEFFKFSHRN